MLYCNDRVKGSRVGPCGKENKQIVLIGFLFVCLFVYLSVYLLNHNYNMFCGKLFAFVSSISCDSWRIWELDKLVIMQ